MGEELQYFISWHSGNGTNSLAEARALAALLAFCIFCDIQSISIFGNSKSTIEHVKGFYNIMAPHLAGWVERIKFFWGLLRDCSIHHIFRAQNQQTDRLSKEGLLLEPGAWSMKVIYGYFSCLIQDFSIPSI